LDIREGEGHLVVRIAAVLFVVIAAHTLLETARDSLFLAELKPNRLALVYGALALLAVFASKASSALSQRYGEKRALGNTLLGTALVTALFYLLPKGAIGVFALYLWTGVATSIVVAQFWILAARVLTVAQARRLLGPIAAGGILGGVLGGGMAVALLKK